MSPTQTAIAAFLLMVCIFTLGIICGVWLATPEWRVDRSVAEECEDDRGDELEGTRPSRFDEWC
jgi:hypothetical protein